MGKLKQSSSSWLKSRAYGDARTKNHIKWGHFRVVLDLFKYDPNQQGRYVQCILRFI